MRLSLFRTTTTTTAVDEEKENKNKREREREQFIYLKFKSIGSKGKKNKFIPSLRRRFVGIATASPFMCVTIKKKKNILCVWKLCVKGGRKGKKI